MPLDVADGRPVRGARAVRLRRGRDVGRRLGQRVLRLGQPDPVERLASGDRDLQRSRVGVADVLRRADDQPPGDELGVLAGGDHRGQPVQGGVGVVAAEALDERRRGVEVPVAGPVVAEDALLRRGLDVLEAGRHVPGLVADVLAVGQRRGTLEDVQRGARVTAGERHEVGEGLVGQGHAAGRTEAPGQPALRVGERPPDDGRDLVVGERLEAPDAHPREERGVHLEVGVLGGRADERDGPVLDVRQQRVLLGLVEAVDLVEEQHGAGAVEGQPVLRLGDRGAHLDDARHHRRQRDEVGADRIRRGAGRGWSCRCPAAPTGGSTTGGHARRCDGAGRAHRRGGPARRTPRGRAGACARRAAVARAVAGRAPRAWLRRGGEWACPDGTTTGRGGRVRSGRTLSLGRSPTGRA